MCTKPVDDHLHFFGGSTPVGYLGNVLKEALGFCISLRCLSRRSRSGNAVHAKLEDTLRKELAATNRTLGLYLVEASRTSFSAKFPLQ